MIARHPTASTASPLRNRPQSARPSFDFARRRLSGARPSPVRRGDRAVEHPGGQGEVTALAAAAIVTSTNKMSDGSSTKASQRSTVSRLTSAPMQTTPVEGIAITLANFNDGTAGGPALPDDPGHVFADAANRGSDYREAARTKGGTARNVANHMWGRDERKALTRLNAWNHPIHRIRGRIEKICGTWKHSCGLQHIRWLDRAKAAQQIRLTAIAYNMNRTMDVVSSAA